MMERSHGAFLFLMSSLLIVCLVLSFFLILLTRKILPIPNDIYTLTRHEAHQYYTRHTAAGPYFDTVADLKIQGHWQPQLHAAGNQLQFDNLWCLQVDVVGIHNQAPVNERSQWVAVKSVSQPVWQVFPLELISSAVSWEQKCAGKTPDGF